jgi:hypothetical protein
MRSVLLRREQPLRMRSSLDVKPLPHGEGPAYAVYVKSPVLHATLLALSLLLSMGWHASSAQEIHAAPASKPSESLEIRGLDGSLQTLTPADLRALPHKTVTVFNAHSKTSESYSGVVLADLLARTDAPVGEKLRGKLFMTGVVAQGTDGYKVLYSVAEVDPVMHSGDVIVADEVDGHPLGGNGAFQLINTEDKRPARWVRNLDRILVMPIETK